MFSKPLLLFTTVLALGSSLTAASENRCRINVGPESQITRKSSAQYDAKEKAWYSGYYESLIAVNPRNPRNLLVASSQWTNPSFPGRGDDKRGRVSALFRSSDGGANWTEVEFHNPVKKNWEASGGDPGVFFNKDGTAIYYEIIEGKNRIYQSRDGGVSWRVLGEFPNGSDHVQWTANTSANPDELIAYGLGLETTPRPDRPKQAEYRLVLQMIDNAGKLSQRDVTNGTEISTILKSNEYLGMNSTDFMMVNRDGKLFLPFQTWSNEAKPGQGEETQRRWLITSSDQGRTNAPPHLITKADGTDLVSGIGTWRPGFAIDTSTGPYSNRLYTTFMDAKSRQGPWALYLSHSDDDGQTWSEPVVIAHEQSIMGQETKDSVYPIVAVNNRGVVMVSWFRENAGPMKYVKWRKKEMPTVLARRVMTASLDGGRTFLPIVPVSTKAAENQNAHYMGIAMDTTGRMHAMWSDQRLGPDMLFHASATVTCNGKPAKARPAS